MADVKITELPPATAGAGTDIHPIVQGGVTKQITTAQILTNATLVTPNIGAATATSINKITFTAPANAATVNFANNSTFTTLGAYSVTLTATNTTVLTLPTSGTVTALGNTTTGAGAIVLATSPALVTPDVGVASATSINKVAITAPAVGATLTIADGKTLTASNSLTLAGTDATVMTFPATSATIARTDAAQTFTGDQTYSNSQIVAGLRATSAAAPTIASAATIAPTPQVVFISGTTAIDTITPPSPISLGGGQITLIPTGLFTTTTAGNIALASTAVVDRALIMTYDVTTTKWYPSY